MTERVRTSRGTWSALQRALLVVLFASLVPIASAAQTITFTSATATWSNAQDNVPGSQPGDPVIANGVPTSSISWGTTTGPQSGYDVTITIPNPAMFPVVDFSHRNFPVSDPSLTQVDLDIVLDFQVNGVPTGPLTFTFTFTHEETPNNQVPCPYPTPPGQGCTDRVVFFSAPAPTTFTVGGKTYTLGMTFLDASGNPISEFITAEGGVVSTTELDVTFALVPPVLETTKSGPATLSLGQPGDFTIDVRNAGPNDAWETTLRDLLPDGATAGMCDATPQVLSAQVFAADGITPAPGKGPLVQGSDYSLTYTAAPTCELVLAMSSPASVIAPNERLIVTYRTQLDGGTQGGVVLANVAGATEWFDDAPSNPTRSAIVRTLSNGTPLTVDHEDAHSLTTALPDFLFEKTVVDPGSGAPLATAQPGDTLRYRLRFENRTGAPLVGLGFRDEIDRLNGSPLFAPGTLALATVPAGADASLTNPNGGAAGTGLVDVRDITVAAGASVLLEFDVTLIATIPDGTLATDQAELWIADAPFGLSDDPGVNGAADPFVNGDEDPTVVTIDSMAELAVEKISAYIDGDPAILLAGERIRYTITVANVGSEDATGVVLRDAVPANTTYVPGSTTLNGAAVADAPGGVSPLVAGIVVTAPAAAATPGLVPADPTSSNPANVATIVFVVLVDPNAVDGTIVSNQAFVTSVAAGITDQPSDDPRTAVADDPTRDVVGNVPVLFASKDVALLADGGTPNVVDPDDTLRYTITISNNGATPLSAATLLDAVPANTMYEPGTTTLNGQPVPDAGGFPLAAGLPVSSSDLTPPLPGAGAGVINGGQSAQVVFVLRVNTGTPVGTIISNQASVTSAQAPSLLTDGDGNPATGPEPTVVVVGGGQQLQITKQVVVVGGGPALAGGQLEYLVVVRNVASVAATDVLITDDLDVPVAGQLTYVPGSALLNGLAAGTSFAGTTVTADFGATYGALAPGATAVLRFRADINGALAMGTRITNTAIVTWNAASQSANASVSIDIGGTPGTGVVSGQVWHDEDFDDVFDTAGPVELALAGWTVSLRRNGALVQSVTTDAAGRYTMAGLSPNNLNGDTYALSFSGPGSGPATASLGLASSVFTNGQQAITDLIVPSGSNLLDLNLPIDPNGVVYDSIARAPLAGVRLELVSITGGSAIPSTCFADPVQQGQVTRTDGYYKFDLDPSLAGCASASGYEIVMTAPGATSATGPSQVIPPTSTAAAPYDVPACPGDAIAAPAGFCEAQTSAFHPPSGVPPTDPTTAYQSHLFLSAAALPGTGALFNNHLPIDPVLGTVIAITKTTPRRDVSRGDLVPYTITVRNDLAAPIADLTIEDAFPGGFRYVEGSARLDGVPTEPVRSDRLLTWANIGIAGAQTRTIVLLLAVGAGVTDGEYTNLARATSGGFLLSGEAAATVRVEPNPDFACTDVLGKVFDDRNRDGEQGSGERGLPGVRLVTARGLVATTDEHGRFHITCAVVPNEDRGSNFLLKLDDRSLPTGYRMSTRQHQVKRATRGKALRFAFGASVHRVIGLDLADGVFEPGTATMREQWTPRLDRVVEELAKEPSSLRLSYVGDTESGALAEARIAAVKREVSQRFGARSDDALAVETEIYWRRGAPGDGGAAGGALSRFSAPLAKLFGAGDGVEDVTTGDAAERHYPGAGAFREWAQDPELLAVERGDRIEERAVERDVTETVKLTGLVPPIRFESGVADIPPSIVKELRGVLDRMADLPNVRLHLVGHADDRPLSARLVAIYGDNEGLSRERAGEVAEYLQAELGLPPESISFAFAGDAQPVASNATEAGRAQNRRVEIEVWHDRTATKMASEDVVVGAAMKRIKICRTETVCMLRYREGHARRARIRNLIPPLHYEDAAVAVPADFLEQVQRALETLSTRENVTVSFVGFTDSTPLEGRDARIYGDPLSLSKARAQRVARVVQDALRLPTAAVKSSGMGSARPVASNDTERGRALNRRIEVEFWHDDPLKQLPDEPRPCPDPSDAEVVTRVYDPPWGRIAPIAIVDGDPVVPDGLTSQLRRAMDDVAAEDNVRLRFVGFTANERLDRRTADVYGDDIGLSAARARRSKELVRAQMDLGEGEVEHEGRGYVHSSDVVNGGFEQGDSDFVSVQVVYDEFAVIDEFDGVDVTPITRELAAQDPLALNRMHITIDGEPIDDPERSSADIQRCTDTALDAANIQFTFDDLEALSNVADARRLSVTASPSTLAHAVEPADGESAAPPDAAVSSRAVRFAAYTNYPHFIARSEVRILEAGDSREAEPLAVVPVDADGMASWVPDPAALGRIPAPKRELAFVLRAYDADGRFDETAPQRLWIVPAGPEAAAAEASAASGPPQARDALLAGYGETGALRTNIPLGDAGTVRVSGTGVPNGHSVWLAGTRIPVDANGSFAAETVLPHGLQTVEVALLDPNGNGELYLRDLELEKSDWFYTGIADLTLQTGKTTGGNDDVLDGKNATSDRDELAEGRLAFFLKGTFGDDWGLTASADTREGPVEDLFKDFVDKTPEALFRRIDSDYFMPTYGDDGTVEETAPTSGKFFLKVTQRDSHAMWGNFKVAYLQNEIAQVDRGLYGANVRYESTSATEFGERRIALDGFAAQPGTLASREEFRGTGGSLYYLRVQDLLEGSERLRIEVRDKDSGLVTGVVHLRPGLDYDIDYIQGRVLLSEPLAAVADDHRLVRSQGLSGDELWLIAQYEYTPGLSDLDQLATGGQAHFWLTDFLKVGATANHNDDDAGAQSDLYAADVTLRHSADSWVKLQYGRSEGELSVPLLSTDGGFGFQGAAAPATFQDAEANGYRADVVVGFSDWIESMKGRLALYAQQLDAGYSSPGLPTLGDTRQYGGLFDLPVTHQLALHGKADHRAIDQGLTTTAAQLDAAYQLTRHWELGVGVRHEQRDDDSPIVFVTQEEGGRTDGTVQLGFDSRGRWRAYVFGQGTIAKSGTRERNDRYGVGGSYRLSEKLAMDGEVSHGESGPALKLGASLLEDEQTRRYMTYALENERGIDGLHERRGNLVSGARTRLSDSSSVYVEDRFQHSSAQRGLGRAMGLDMALSERWSLSAKWELGTLVDATTQAETERRAGGGTLAYRSGDVQLSSGIEFRYDETEDPFTGATSDRTTWLFKNNLRYQLTPSWRALAKANHSTSNSSLGDFFDGGYTEVVLGTGYRPVKHDRFDVLAKYTYFSNMPTTGQITSQQTSAQFIQRSHIASLDATYDLTSRWSLGGKYAYRRGEVSLDRTDPEFFRNDAHLAILRTDYRLLKNWEVLAEGRMLVLPDIDESRAGSLFTLYRYFGDNIKAGVGYNFTDFSEDLTDLSYDHHGFFFNVVGSF